MSRMEMMELAADLSALIRNMEIQKGRIKRAMIVVSQHDLPQGMDVLADQARALRNHVAAKLAEASL